MVHASSGIPGLALVLLACGGGAPEPEPSPDFSPVSDTTLGGNKSFRSVTIPAGVTVTSGVLYLEVSEDLRIAGTLRAPCGVLHLNVAGTVTVSGTIDNGCPVPSDSGGSLTIIGQRSWILSGATVTSSGDVAIVNAGSDTIPAGAPGLARIIPNPLNLDASSWRCQLIASSISTSPLTRRTAADSVGLGKNGRRGADRLLACGHAAAGITGGSLLIESSTIVAGNGGKGGNGLLSNAGQAQGGVGGAPGAIVLLAENDIDFRGGVTITGGSAGSGGDASPTGANGIPGASVAAIGGKGADLVPEKWAHSIVIRSGGSVNQAGTLVMSLGKAGDGGRGVATGGAGVPATTAAAGGNASATGGQGGNAAGIELEVGGAVNRSGQIQFLGGAGGEGGDANCRGGQGGPGSQPGAPGGRGGDMTCQGGTGGRGLSGGAGPFAMSSPGGKGGLASVLGAANGGSGGGRCAPPVVGGAGGPGGTVLAIPGLGGIGDPNGASGILEIVTTGNGGRGGNGEPPGSGGLAGTNSSGTAVLLTDSFVAGSAGAGCF